MTRTKSFLRFCMAASGYGSGPLIAVRARRRHLAIETELLQDPARHRCGTTRSIQLGPQAGPHFRARNDIRLSSFNLRFATRGQRIPRLVTLAIDIRARDDAIQEFRSIIGG